ncbi:MAG TPA: hypothetical protein VMS65_07605 [Polyangiaceae bacterium]|nr:hypothetical protein [Polyangiaceae bacterium]
MTLGFTRFVPLVALIALAPACKKKAPPPVPTVQASASVSAVASAVVAPSASVAARADEAPDAAPTNERMIAAGTTPGGLYLGAFALRRLDESPGLAFGKAVEACALTGKFLCSEPEWQLACAADPGLTTLETWTYSAERDRAVVRGGDGSCDKRALVNPAESASARATLCCDRAIGVQGSDAGDAAQKIGERLLVYERGLRERKAEDLAAVTLETLVFAGKELKREELLPVALAALLPDASAETTLFDSCAVRSGVEGAGQSATLECVAARLRPTGPEELRWKLATLGPDYRLSRIELPAPPAPSEQKQRVGGFLPSR